MATPRRLAGIAAAPGFAAGPIRRQARSAASYAPSGDRETEAARLAAAIAAAREQIVGLMASADGEGAAILEFQAAMLEDESLAEPAIAAIGDGSDAAAAWITALAAQIDDYASADDDYFRARSADMADIRDRVLGILTGTADETLTPGAIFVGHDLTPSAFLAADWRGGGIVLEAGSARGHVAMLARARGVPMVVGVGPVDASPGQRALVDAAAGTVVIQPDTADGAAFERNRATWSRQQASAAAGLSAPAVTRDGTTIAVLINIAGPGDVDGIDPGDCDGVGLMRTEFLFGGGLPDEETQYRAYARVLSWAGDKPVTIRTVDAGGDKPVPGYTVDEANPFLGLRGIRLSLRRQEVFRGQVRALLRAGQAGNLRVMLPMVTVPAELAAARALFVAEAAALGLLVPPIGIMVEVPAVALAPELFADAAFLSIGSNDLAQYVMAAARDNGAVASLCDVLHPAVVGLIAATVRAASAMGIPVSLCGDAGGDSPAIPALLGTGLRSLSVAPAQLAATKDAIRRVTLDG